MIQAPRLSVATVFFRQPILVALNSASQMGASGVQLDAREELRPGSLTGTGVRDFLRRVHDLGLNVESLKIPTSKSLYNRENLDLRIETIKETMRFAQALGAGTVTLQAGKIPAEEQIQDYDLLRQVGEDLAGYGSHVGVVPSWTSTGESPETWLKFLTRIETGILGLDFDPASFVMAGFNTASAIRELHESISHILARDAVLGFDGSGREMPLGKGAIDWLEMMAILSEIKYPGWLTVVRSQGDRCFAESAEALERLNQQWSMFRGA